MSNGLMDSMKSIEAETATTPTVLAKPTDKRVRPHLLHVHYSLEALELAVLRSKKNLLEKRLKTIQEEFTNVAGQLYDRENSDTSSDEDLNA